MSVRVWTVACWSVFAALGCVVSPDLLRGFDRHTLPKEAMVHLLGGVAAVVLFRRGPRRDFVVLGALAFCAVSLVSALFAQNVWTAFRALGLTFSATAIFLAARTLSRERTELMLAGVVWAGISAAGFAVLEAFGAIDGFSTPGRAPSGTFGNRNAMAHVVALCLPSAAWLVLASTDRTRRWFATGFVALATGALVMSRCRTAWVALAIALVVGVVVGRKELPRWPSKRLAVFALAVALGIGLALLPNDLRWKSPSPYLDSLRSLAAWEQPSARGRLDQAAFTVEMALDFPVFGVGPGNFRVHAPEYVRRAGERGSGSSEQTLPRLPNDDWLGVWAERGTLAAVCLLALLFACGRRFWRPPSEWRAASLLGLVTLSLVLCMGALDAVLTQGVPVAVTAIVLGTSLPAKSRGEPRPILARPTLPWIFGVVALGSLLRIGVQLYAGRIETTKPLEIDRLERAARIDRGNRDLAEDLARYWIAKGDCNRAAAHLERLAVFYPYDRETRILQTKCPRSESDSER